MRQILRGRGSSDNPPNRFDRMDYETISEEPVEAELSIDTKFYRDASRTILSRNDSPDVGFEVSLNPYRGCEHGCTYCYARPTHEYLGFSAGLDFEARILVKEDAPELLRKELMKRDWKPEPIGLSGVTDPYQPIEKELMITRRCLQVLAEFRNPVMIATKNHLITRDLDLLRELAAHRLVVVNLSVTTLDSELQRRLEPRACTPSRRLAAIRELTEAGIPTRVLVAPVIPALTDFELPKILKAAAQNGATSASYILLRLPHSVKQLFTSWMECHLPGRKKSVLGRIRETRSGQLNDPKFCSRMTGEGAYASQIRRLFEISCRRLGLNRQVIELSTSLFQRPTAQPNLFEMANRLEK